MALACWMWALDLILESTQVFSVRKLNLAAVCLGLSMVASLAFAAPAVRPAGSVPRSGSGWARLARPRARTLPHLCSSRCSCCWPSRSITRSGTRSAIGATSLRQTINEITALSLGTSLKVLAAAARVGVALAGASREPCCRCPLLAPAGWRSAGAHRSHACRSPWCCCLAHTAGCIPRFRKQGAIYLIPLLCY